MNKYPRVLGISHAPKPGAVDAYRLIYPLNKMRAIGYHTAVVSAIDVANALRDGARIHDEFDVVVMHGLNGRQDETEITREMALMLRAVGVTVLIDYDDDYTNTHRKVHDHELVGLDAFSGITVSTPYLRGVMSKYNRNVRVIPNAIVPEMLAGFRRIIDGTVIGLTGSVTHKKDWEAVIDPIFAAAKKHPHVKVFCTGLVPERMYALGDQLITVRKLFPELASDFEDDNFYVPLHDYGGILRNIDILLAPVDPGDRFNWSKSNLKAIEGQSSPREIEGFTGMGGCAVIATGDIPNYQDAISDGKTGFLVNHHDEAGWFNAIEKCITDVKLCRSVQIAGHESALRTFNIHRRIGERVATYLDFIELDRKSRAKVQATVAAMVDSGFATAKPQE